MKMRWSGRKLTFQGSNPGSPLIGDHLLSSADIVGEILQCMLIKMYLYVLCWCFIEVCEENSTSATSETAPDTCERNKIRFKCWRDSGSEDKEHEDSMGRSRQKWNWTFTLRGTDQSHHQLWIATSPLLYPLSPQLIGTQSGGDLSLVQHWNEIKDEEALIVFKDWSTLILCMCFREGVGGHLGLAGAFM